MPSHVAFLSLYCFNCDHLTASDCLGAGASTVLSVENLGLVGYTSCEDVAGGLITAYFGTVIFAETLGS